MKKKKDCKWSNSLRTLKAINSNLLYRMRKGVLQRQKCSLPYHEQHSAHVPAPPLYSDHITKEHYIMAQGN